MLLDCLAGLCSAGRALAAVPASPANAPFANLWYPKDGRHLLYSTFVGAALYYNIVDWQPGYVERSNCRLIDAGAPTPEADRARGPAYTYTIYTTLCTDVWGQDRYGKAIHLLPILQCPANSVQAGSVCNCNPGFVEEGAACIEFVGRPVEDVGAIDKTVI